MGGEYADGAGKGRFVQCVEHSTTPGFKDQVGATLDVEVAIARRTLPYRTGQRAAVMLTRNWVSGSPGRPRSA